MERCFGPREDRPLWLNPSRFEGVCPSSSRWWNERRKLRRDSVATSPSSRARRTLDTADLIAAVGPRAATRSATTSTSGPSESFVARPGISCKHGEYELGLAVEPGVKRHRRMQVDEQRKMSVLEGGEHAIQALLRPAGARADDLDKPCDAAVRGRGRPLRRPGQGEEGQQQDGEPEREDGLRRSPGPRCREAEAPCDVGRYLRPA